MLIKSSGNSLYSRGIITFHKIQIMLRSLRVAGNGFKYAEVRVGTADGSVERAEARSGSNTSRV